MTTQDLVYEQLLVTAHRAAAQVVVFESEHQPEDPRALDCGFAWVTIPGRSALAAYCRRCATADNRQRYGSKDYPTGWHFWCPGGHYGQSIRIHEAGAKAFREVLAAAGISATVHSRLD